MTSIALIGSRPVGTLLAASLLHNGVDFHWVVRDPQRRAQLELGSLPLRSAQQAYSLHLSGIERPDFATELPLCDWYILAVKAQHVLPLLAELQPYPGGNVLAVSNGIHEGPFHLGILHGGAYLDEGALVTGATNRLRIGTLGEIADRSSELLNLLPAPWLEIEPVRDTADRMWRKAALNCIVNPLTALLDCENGALTDAVEGPLVRGLLDELVQVLHRETNGRVTLLPDELGVELHELLALTAVNSSSMREDFRRGREPEIEHLNLAVARLGRQHGIACPLNESLGRMVLALANNM